MTCVGEDMRPMTYSSQPSYCSAMPVPLSTSIRMVSPVCIAIIVKQRAPEKGDARKGKFAEKR